ncbi:hypothetical protein ACVIWV_000975 [Bradyrhizobium diazoefficiens]|jgi:hypothetical protein|uniref:Uncharacterized protein n=1 Tax=Bradyrhizobium diazoefficiens TaxID=1355477 RepID=A0A0E4BKF5_9BRAD|nr:MULTISPECIES: hypothetical protein [Bradyrhizobium]MBP1063319.1 hypothetical protein [Bradyrhizobium japonicum]MBP1090843.1 hypothetical protein [Bradyrhizobium japonicum]MDC8023822.1 hypothetical protein [Bradyrhizobium diazoefficiens]MDK4226106.1 hypothetical protein [Bradyrhizobium diazoefficiens]WLA54663.1 hypothetical protein QIH81_29545 [Bradyrhizobium diazoefficiens]
MKKRLSVALQLARDTATAGAPKDVAKADVWLPSLIKPITG